MKHEDHVALIRAGIEGAGPRWLELGAGDGAFTLALADLLESGGITSLDRDSRGLAEAERRVRHAYPATALATMVADFTTTLPQGPFDGVLAANSLHFVREPAPVIAAIRRILVPGGRLVIVEYDADRGNAWVPYPISFDRWVGLAVDAGLAQPVRIHSVPSRFLGSIYGAVAASLVGAGA